jgi:NADH-quinone oxidoreductase subunit G
VSPALSNEDLLAALAVARDSLGAREVFVTGRPDGEADFFLMTADKNPNRRGLTAIARGLGIALRPFADLTGALDRGDVEALVAFGHDVPEAPERFAARLGRVGFVAVVAAGTSALTEAAHAVLCGASHLEDEGTYTQEAGRTQRFRRAFPPREGSRPAWQWAAALAEALGGALRAASSREVFRALAPAVPELASFDWDAAAPVNQAHPGIQTLPAGADGRPPGWREAGVPNMRGLTLPRGT